MSSEKSHPTLMRDRNRDSWNTERYDLWVSAYGAPEVEAARLVADPENKVRRLLPYLGEVVGKRICNIQGSHGRVAVALAVLGADVTVIDFAEENRRYALELAARAGVVIDYLLGDVIEAGSLGLNGTFDALAMELGILHYHHDLGRFFAVMADLAKPGGRMVLNEFHPVERKLFTAPGVLHDYFSAEVVMGATPDPTSQGRDLGQCALRFWTLGEVVTTAIGAGFVIERLEELPSWTDPIIPGMFTLVAVKAAS
ncbi:MAG TPA: methyltransferase domain-containing protein [Caulobacteraceae bacterium]|nr:methyltransferase domain-containing protein [Caulobacteraceae bacterium]